MFALSPVLIHRPVKDGFDPFQYVCASEEQPDHSHSGIECEDWPGSSYNQEFRDKTIQPRQTQRGHAGKNQNSTVDWYQGKQTPEIFQVAGVGTFVEHAHKEKHASGREAMVKHLQYGSVKGNCCIKSPGRLGSGSDAKYNEAHVVYRRISHQSLEVFLSVSGEGTEHNRHNSQECQPPRIFG